MKKRGVNKKEKQKQVIYEKEKIKIKKNEWESQKEIEKIEKGREMR